MLCVFFLVPFTSHSQEKKDPKDNTEQKNEFWKHVQFGGGINLSFGNNVTNLGLSPSALYNFSDSFSAGLGVSYLYTKNKFYGTSANVYGGSLITLFNPFKSGQLSAEFEQLRVNYSGSSAGIDYSVPALYFGAAYTFGKNMAAGIRYDALYDQNKSLYPSAFSPFFRVYF